ncbi:MAG TPA: sigma-54 factor interaction domain-containing protein, partial [Nannocystis exedens]|nr:sigma-54 factor interaction domain-containing protein [Nannocystis exedens]
MHCRQRGAQSRYSRLLWPTAYPCPVRPGLLWRCIPGACRGPKIRAACRDMSGLPLERPEREPQEFFGIYTVSPQMLAFFDLLPRVARSGASVLIRGETGTGKELAARALHLVSPRKDGPFRAINCATLTAELLASELFGHVRGSFTGALRDRPGLFSLADKGTIFLDEIAEMPLEIQARLLRVLQERTFVPLGGSESRTVDVRVLSATHRALREE